MSKSEQWLDDPLGYLLGSDRVADFHERIYERVERLSAAPNLTAHRLAGKLPNRSSWSD